MSKNDRMYETSEKKTKPMLRTFSIRLIEIALLKEYGVLEVYGNPYSSYIFTYRRKGVFRKRQTCKLLNNF